MSNPYYKPEDFGLVMVGTFDHNDEPYQFDMTVVWRSTVTGKFYYASDAGCSCPSPFEDCEMEDLVEFSDISTLARYLADSGGDVVERLDFVYMVRKEMNGNGKRSD